VAFKLCQNPFSAEALPRTSPGRSAHDVPPDPLVGWGRDNLPIHHPTRRRPTFGARHASPRMSARYTPMPREYAYSSQGQVKGRKVTCHQYLINSMFTVTPNIASISDTARTTDTVSLSKTKSDTCFAQLSCCVYRVTQKWHRFIALKTLDISQGSVATH